MSFKEVEFLNLRTAVKLIQMYGACLECGNEHIGDNEGVLIIDVDVFYRTCKCGWNVRKSGEEWKELAK